MTVATVAIAFLLMGALLFIVNAIFLIVMVKEFANMRVTAVLMEAAFKENSEMTQNIQAFMSSELETIATEFKKTINETHTTQERVNNLERNMRKPMTPDCTFN